jgi:DNA-binding GntR family transcriptional regulator
MPVRLSACGVVLIRSQWNVPLNPSRLKSEPRASGSESLKQQAYLKLKRLILAGELPSGTVLSVRQLATQLEMSRTPVHAAIERLEADGLVTLAPQQGVMVREMTMQDIVNHYQIRQALEPFVLSRLAGKLSEEQIQQLRENQSRYDEATHNQLMHDVVEIDAEFHRLLFTFFGNDEITGVLERLSDRIRRVIYRISQKSPERMAESCEEHQAILDALIEGDGEHAAKLASDHLERGLGRLWSGA